MLLSERQLEKAVARLLEIRAERGKNGFRAIQDDSWFLEAKLEVLKEEKQWNNRVIEMMGLEAS